MVSPLQPDLLNVDWTKVPAPVDDGAARHLVGLALPDLALAATDGMAINPSRLPGRSVVFVYPRTGVPGEPSPVPEWDMIPGARGCTPQSCAFRDLHAELTAAGASHVFGLSVQDTGYQREAAERLHLPFPLLSDVQLEFVRALSLPTMAVGDLVLIRRLAMVIDDGRITHVFFPVFPPDRNADDVLAWLKANPRGQA
jgi:peroxiredoxin (alkyl hydroperoxide reductase subunit C)